MASTIDPNPGGLVRVLIGRPLRTDEAPHQTIGKAVGLAVFASDALSSVAYATQEILVVLAGAAAMMGSAVFSNSVPIAFAIVTLLLILTVSYRQTIFAYPGGGGAYIVARDNLGEAPAQTAGAALLTDYILTVAVSVSSGWEQVASAIPALHPFRVELAVASVVVMMIINLRGVKESGRVFAVPTYFFLVTILVTLVAGAVRWSTGTLGIVTGVVMMQHTATNFGLFLLLHAFSSGCTALTGVEAISNGITAFKEPKSKNAASTMLAMSVILGVMFIGITVLANRVQALPSESNTVISQVGYAVWGSSVMYGLVIASTMIILIMAANTAFADFPRLCALHAGDGFLPRQLTHKGSRLVFSWGIFALSLAAIALIVLFDAQTTRLIPLYAIGVFLSFTLSQAGMVVRWKRVGTLKPGGQMETKNPHGDAIVLCYDQHWRIKQGINAVGAVMSAVVMLVFAVTKFADGAWVTVFLIPGLVYVFFRIHRHYTDVAKSLSTAAKMVNPTPRPMYTVVLIDDVHMGTVNMVEFAMSQRGEWVAVHFDDKPEKTAVIKQKWAERLGACDRNLTIVPAPYRNLASAVADYILELKMLHPDSIIQVVMGQIIMDSFVAQALHSNTTVGIKIALNNIDGVVVTDVAYQIHAPEQVLATA